jgi:hypothetical protein
MVTPLNAFCSYLLPKFPLLPFRIWVLKLVSVYEDKAPIEETLSDNEMPEEQEEQENVPLVLIYQDGLQATPMPIPIDARHSKRRPLSLLQLSNIDIDNVCCFENAPEAKQRIVYSIKSEVISDALLTGSFVTQV